MSDVMNFPNSPEEFIEQYSFTDKERVYTNGIELIPVFRVCQMLEHYTRKAMERILTRLEEKAKSIYKDKNEGEQFVFLKDAIMIVKEEGGIE